MNAPGERRAGAIGALLGGATCIGVAPILVRLSESGPSATAAFRLLFALPFLWLWTGIEKRSGNHPPRLSRGFYTVAAAAGFFFAGDMAFWHWSLQFTTVANSTLFTNFAPFFVAIGAHFLLGEKITWQLMTGFGVAFAGGVLLVAHSFELSAANLLGDSLALITSVFYAGYLLAIKQLRGSYPTSLIMLFSGLVSCPLLFLSAGLSMEVVLPQTGKGWAVLVALAIVSHIGGQCLIAYALAHLPASFSSVGLLWQPVMAALLAAWILQEKLSVRTLIGGMIVLCGIAVAGGMFSTRGKEAVR